MILEEIKKRNVQALKEKDMNTRAICSVVMNKAMLLGIEKKTKGDVLTDADMVGILQKTIKELAEEAENYKKAGNSAQCKNIELQGSLLKGYLPKMMSEAEIKKIINSLPDKSIGAVMKHFREHYAGKVEMSMVQQALK